MEHRIPAPAVGNAWQESHFAMLWESFRTGSVTALPVLLFGGMEVNVSSWCFGSLVEF
ncbi:hypothetical protein [Dyadobacter sp. SG02]|uniref:hypothetical protein n=1 Tax=Dyadobacter sp. SG02 TaxID=1855291 RepID=UPI0015A572F1|nr:hypothetical protein [Dyadobacter sp. SG02]